MEIGQGYIARQYGLGIINELKQGKGPFLRWWIKGLKCVDTLEGLKLLLVATIYGHMRGMVTLDGWST